VFAVLLALYASAACAQELDPAAKWATIAAYEYQVDPDVVYKRATNVDLKPDIITAGPRTQVRPTVIYIHGGGWMVESKRSFALLPLPLLTRGMNVVNIDYRLASAALAPAAVEDCRCALRWVFAHSKEYGIDTKKLVIEGHSAGGHLALMTGMLEPGAGFDNECPGKEELKVSAIVNYFGITDVADLLEGPNIKEFALMWFGSLPNRLALANKLSPLTYVRPGLPPIITLQGDKDPVVPYQHGVRLHDALDRAGVTNELVTIRGGGHAGWSREENMKAQEAVFQFLHRCGIL
jgi:acetyl esterase/lipase